MLRVDCALVRRHGDHQVATLRFHVLTGKRQVVRCVPNRTVTHATLALVVQDRAAVVEPPVRAHHHVLGRGRSQRRRADASVGVHQLVA